MKINVELEEDDWYEVVGYLREGHLDPIALEIDRQAGERRGGDVALEAMLLELQRRYGVVSLTGDNRFGGPGDQWELIAGDEYEDSGYIYTASSPLAAVVQAYRAVVQGGTTNENI
jgi:hypothetical protein